MLATINCFTFQSIFQIYVWMPRYWGWDGVIIIVLFFYVVFWRVFYHAEYSSRRINVP